MNPQLAVAIAKDVLARLPTLEIRQRVYLSSAPFKLAVDSDLTINAMLETTSCKCCALGTCFLSYIAITKGGNNLIRDSQQTGLVCHLGLDNYSFHPRKYVISHTLKEVFGEENMCLMEVCFEMNTMMADEYLCSKQFVKDAYNFGRKYEYSPEDRLTAILENVIMHNGFFLP